MICYEVGLGLKHQYRKMCCSDSYRNDPGSGFIKAAFLGCFFYFYFVAAVYILYSNRINRFYIGSCINLDKRLEEHKNKVFPASFTSITDDWELFLSFENLDYNQARNIELHIKKMKSSKYIRNLKLHEELRNKLIIINAK
jgi:putative endonuclease